jgi:hypothetical protein
MMTTGAEKKSSRLVPAFGCQSSAASLQPPVLLDRVLLFWDERWILKQFLWGNPRCAEDDLRISQQVERLANIEEKYLLF